MCVIMIVEDNNLRPTIKMIEKAFSSNDDGGGVAWREEVEQKGKDGKVITERRVFWKKGLDLDDMKQMAEELPVPFIMHFRRASIGGVTPKLTHPFPVNEKVSLALEGSTTGAVLFHNGTWKEWAGYSLNSVMNKTVKLPAGKWSDSRALAFMTYIYGQGFMELLPEQRGVLFGANGMDVYAGPGWDRVFIGSGKDDFIWCSNKWFLDIGKTSSVNGNTGPWCKNARCNRKDQLDSDGYCPQHRIKKEEPTPKALPAGTGGAQQVTPFPAQVPKGEIIKLEVAEYLHQCRDAHGARLIGKHKLQSIRKYYGMVASPDQKDRMKGLKKLLELSEGLPNCEIGPAASTQSH